MPGLTVLDVFIGLSLIYLLLSLLCTASSEIIENLVKWRAKDLHRGIKELLDDEGSLTRKMYEHQLIAGLFEGKYDESVKPTERVKPLNPPVQNDASNASGTLRPPESAVSETPRIWTKLPSYIPATNFALALLDIAVNSASNEPRNSLSSDSLKSVLQKPGALNPKTRQALLTIIEHAGSDLSSIRAGVESWFNSGMDRVSGWYKRRSQWILIIIGFVAAVCFNVD